MLNFHRKIYQKCWLPFLGPLLDIDARADSLVSAFTSIDAETSFSQLNINSKKSNFENSVKRFLANKAAETFHKANEKISNSKSPKYFVDSTKFSQNI